MTNITSEFTDIWHCESDNVRVALYKMVIKNIQTFTDSSKDHFK